MQRFNGDGQSRDLYRRRRDYRRNEGQFTVQLPPEVRQYMRKRQDVAWPAEVKRVVIELVNAYQRDEQ